MRLETAFGVTKLAERITTILTKEGQAFTTYADNQPGILTGALERAWALSTSNLVSLSEQQLVDCNTTDLGCNEGLMDYASAFAEKNAICTEGSYPYTAQDGT